MRMYKMEIQKYFDEEDKVIEFLDELIKNAIDEKITIFKRFSDENYYYLYNKTALNYC